MEELILTGDHLGNQRLVFHEGRAPSPANTLLKGGVANG